MINRIYDNKNRYYIDFGYLKIDNDWRKYIKIIIQKKIGQEKG